MVTPSSNVNTPFVPTTAPYSDPATATQYTQTAAYLGATFLSRTDTGTNLLYEAATMNPDNIFNNSIYGFYGLNSAPIEGQDNFWNQVGATDPDPKFKFMI